MIGTEQRQFMKNLLDVLARRFWIMLLVVLLTVGTAIGATFLQTPQYESSVEVLVGQDQGISDTPNDAVGLQQITQTMTEIARSRPVAEAVIEDQNLRISVEDFSENLNVEQVDTTQVIEISYTDPVPDRAKSIADSTGEAFSDEVASITSNANPITATLLSEAEVSDSQASPQPIQTGILGLALGMLLSVGVAYLLEFLDDSWHSPEEAEEISGVPTFGVIPVFKASTDKKHVAGSQKGRAAAIQARLPHVKDQERITLGDFASERHFVWPMSVLFSDQDGKIIDSNSTFRELVGHSADEIAGEDFVRFATHPDDIEAHSQLDGKMREGEIENYRIEKRLVNKAGQLLWARYTVSCGRNSERQPTFEIAMIEDVSELKGSEERLRISSEEGRISRERLSAILETSPLIVSSFTPEGDALISNAAWDEYWHKEPSDSNGNVYRDPQVQDSGLLEYIKSSSESKESLVTPDLQFTPTNNGHSPRWIKAAINPIKDDSDRVVELMVILQDITERKLTEKAVENSDIERREARKAREDLEETFKTLLWIASDNHAPPGESRK